MGVRSPDCRPSLQEVKYLLGARIIAVVLNSEQGHITRFRLPGRHLFLFRLAQDASLTVGPSAPIAVNR